MYDVKVADDLGNADIAADEHGFSTGRAHKGVLDRGMREFVLLLS